MKKFKVGVYIIVLAAVFGFFWLWAREARLVNREPLQSWLEDQKADCAVVLTGSPNRVREGFDLLSQGLVKKIIISGVHPDAQFHEIFPLWPYYRSVSPSDVVLEKSSMTTYGNAQQALPLVEALNCRDIILVTSYLHMRRAYLTFRATFPDDIPIYSRSTVGRGFPPSIFDHASESLKSLFYSFWAYGWLQPRSS